MLTTFLMAAAMFVVPGMASAVLPHETCHGALHGLQDVTVPTGLCEADG